MAASTVRRVILTEDELKSLVAQSVRETLMVLGVDAENPLEMQRDFQHLREWRQTTDSIKSKTAMVIITVLVTGALGALYVGIKGMLVAGR